MLEGLDLDPCGGFIYILKTKIESWFVNKTKKSRKFIVDESLTTYQKSL